jgi:hypothetical protein
MFDLLKLFFIFGAVLGLKINWVKSTEVLYVLPTPIQKEPPPIINMLHQKGTLMAINDLTWILNHFKNDF